MTISKAIPYVKGRQVNSLAKPISSMSGEEVSQLRSDLLKIKQTRIERKKPTGTLYHAGNPAKRPQKTKEQFRAENHENRLRSREQRLASEAEVKPAETALSRNRTISNKKMFRAAGATGISAGSAGLVVARNHSVKKDNTDVALGAISGGAGAHAVYGMGGWAAKKKIESHRNKAMDKATPAQRKEWNRIWNDHKKAHGVEQTKSSMSHKAREKFYLTYPKDLPGGKAQRMLAFKNKKSVYAGTMLAGASAGGAVAHKYSQVDKSLPSILRTGKKFVGPHSDYANNKIFNNKIGLNRAKLISENKEMQTRLLRINEMQKPLRYNPQEAMMRSLSGKPAIPLNESREKALANVRRPLENKIKENEIIGNYALRTAENNKKNVREIIRRDAQNKIDDKAAAKAKAEAEILAAKKKKDFQRKTLLGVSGAGILGAGVYGYKKYSSVNKDAVIGSVGKSSNVREYPYLSENVREWTLNGPAIRRNPYSPVEMLSSGMMMAQAQSAGYGRHMTKKERIRAGKNIRDYGEGRMFIYSPLGRGSVMT